MLPFIAENMPLEELLKRYGGAYEDENTEEEVTRDVKEVQKGRRSSKSRGWLYLFLLFV